MRISLCMIVRDEELDLGACLESVAPAVDEVCIVDTGSRDGTRAIAASFGARIEQVPWTDDFAAARNRSLALAEGDRALVLDADERLLEPQRARDALEAFALAHPGAVGSVWIVNRTADGDIDSRARVSRFMPLDGAHHFEGRVHEQIVCAGRDVVRRECGVELDHLGYTPEALARRDKLARNRTLLERALAAAPDDAYLCYQLGRTLAVGDEHAAALTVFEHALAHCPDDAPYGAHLAESAAYSLRALDRSAQALVWLSELEAQYADRADMVFLIALLAMDSGNLLRAEQGFRRCLKLAGRLPPGGESSPAASTYAPAFNLGVMREVLGRTDEARELYQRALTFHPGHAPSREGLARLGGAAIAEPTRNA